MTTRFDRHAPIGPLSVRTLDAWEAVQQHTVTPPVIPPEHHYHLVVNCCCGCGSLWVEYQNSVGCQPMRCSQCCAHTQKHSDEYIGPRPAGWKPYTNTRFRPNAKHSKPSLLTPEERRELWGGHNAAYSPSKNTHFAYHGIARDDI